MPSSLARAVTACAAALVFLTIAPPAPVHAKGAGPTSVAVGYGAVWIGTGDGKLLRFDLATSRFRSIRLGTFVWSLTLAGRAVWATSAAGVARVDPTTGRFSTIEPGPQLTMIARAAGAVWVGSAAIGRVYRIDLTSGRVTRTIVFPGRLSSMWAGPRVLWLQTIPGRGPSTGPAGVRLLRRVDAGTARLVGRPLRETCDSAVAADGRYVWIGDVCSGTLRRIETATGRSDGRSVRIGELAALRVASGSLWAADRAAGRVLRVDRRRAVVASRIPIRAPIGFAPGPGGLWVVTASGELRLISFATNSIVRSIRLPR